MTDATRETLTELELSVADNLANQKDAYGGRFAVVGVDASDLAAARFKALAAQMPKAVA